MHINSSRSLAQRSAHLCTLGLQAVLCSRAIQYVRIPDTSAKYDFGAVHWLPMASCLVASQLKTQQLTTAFADELSRSSHGSNSTTRQGTDLPRVLLAAAFHAVVVRAANQALGGDDGVRCPSRGRGDRRSPWRAWTWHVCGRVFLRVPVRVDGRAPECSARALFRVASARFRRVLSRYGG